MVLVESGEKREKLVLSGIKLIFLEYSFECICGKHSLLETVHVGKGISNIEFWSSSQSLFQQFYALFRFELCTEAVPYQFSRFRVKVIEL